MLRLFIAVDLPERLRQDVTSMCKDVTNARWTNPAQLHITLRFMGKTPEERLGEMRRRLAMVRHPPFALALAGVGIFPESAPPTKARVLWLGFADPQALGTLKRAIDDRLGDIAPPEERTGFSPHLTLARFSRRPDATLARLLDRVRAYRSASWTVTHFHLYRSTVSSVGARHALIDSLALATDGPRH